MVPPIPPLVVAVITALRDNTPVVVATKAGAIWEGRITECRLPWFALMDHEYGRQVLRINEVQAVTNL